MTTTKTAAPVQQETKPPDPMTLEQKRERLRARFPDAAYGKLPKPFKKDSPKGKCHECGGYHGLPAVHLDYIGHATVTDRLLEVDPDWNWEPVAFDERGLPRFLISESGTPIGLWIRLTVLGVTRLGYGSVESNAFEPEKQLIGDALRNAAMRFGVALDLWSKAELESAALSHGDGNGHDKAKPAPAGAAPKSPPRTLQEAAGRAQPKEAPRAVQHENVQGRVSGEGDDGGDLIPWEPELERYEDGSMKAWGIPIPARLIESRRNWENDAVTRNPKTKIQAVKGRTWGEMLLGKPDGGRERALRLVVNLAMRDANAGKEVSEWSQKAAYTLLLLRDMREQAFAQDTPPPHPADSIGDLGPPSADWRDDTPF